MTRDNAEHPPKPHEGAIGAGTGRAVEALRPEVEKQSVYENQEIYTPVLCSL